LARVLVSSLPSNLKANITTITVGGHGALVRLVKRKNHSIIEKVDRILMLPLGAIILLRIAYKWRFGFLDRNINLTRHKINSNEVILCINSLKPERVLLIGTELLKSPESIDCATILNLHSGLAPEYRGMWNWFWPSYHKDFKRNGATIHFLEVKADTGRILLQEKYRTLNSDSLQNLLHKSMNAQRSLLLKFFSGNFHAEPLTRTKVGVHFYEPGISDLILFKLNRRKP
jgi:folate-dependent phosphoribosylglycinamide formyltransferase PurN